MLGMDAATKKEIENQKEARYAAVRATLGLQPPRLCCCIARSGKLDRARSRLYRSQILQVNMRLKALAEIYTMHSFAQLCNLNFLSKICYFF